MRKLFQCFGAALLSLPLLAAADDRGNIVIGSVLGGATGAVIGNNLGGRDGAIVGGVIGAAAGATIATDRGGYHDDRDDRRYRSGYNDYGYRQDQYQYRDHYRRYGHERPREVVVVESPRHYYYGNDFVYGVPPRQDHGHHYYGHNRRHDRREYRRDYRHDDRRQQVIIIQPAPRRW